MSLKAKEKPKYVSPIYKFGNGFIDTRDVSMAEHHPLSDDVFGKRKVTLSNNSGVKLATFTEDNTKDAENMIARVLKVKLGYERWEASR